MLISKGGRLSELCPVLCLPFLCTHLLQGRCLSRGSWGCELGREATAARSLGFPSQLCLGSLSGRGSISLGGHGSSCPLPPWEGAGRMEMSRLCCFSLCFILTSQAGDTRVCITMFSLASLQTSGLCPM